MGKRIQKVRSILLALLFVFSTVTSAYATAKASDYFAVTEAWATALGRGKVLIEFDMGTTHTMNELGALHIVVKEQQSDGSFKSVKTFSRYNTSGLIDKNSTSAYGRVTYYGTSGKKYYAIVAFYAADDDGSEILQQFTNTITA